MNPLLAAALLSAAPIAEVRGGIPYAILSGINPWIAFLVCTLANIAIIPIVLLFLNFVHDKLLHQRHYAKFFDWLIDRTRKKIEPKIRKWEYWGLFVFVAIPFPGTGAYTGALGAWLFGMDSKKSFCAIAAGVVAAGLVMTALSIGGNAALGGNEFSATLMLFQSPEGVQKAELNIFGPAKAIKLLSPEKELQKDVEISGSTLFITDLQPEEVGMLGEKIIFSADGKRSSVKLSENHNWTVTHIEMKNGTVLLDTAISPPLENQKLLLWTTVQETSVQLDTVQPLTWIKRPSIGGYWLFNVNEEKSRLNIGVTPPEKLEDATAEDIAQILLSKVTSFNLVLLGQMGKGTIVRVTVPLASAGEALGNKTVDAKLFSQ